MDNLYDFSLKKLKADSIDEILKGKDNVANVIVNHIRKEIELKHRNGTGIPEELIEKLNTTINEILATHRTIVIDQVYLSLSSAIRELEAEEIRGEDFKLQQCAIEETKNVIQNELKNILEYETNVQSAEIFEEPLQPYPTDTPIVDEHFSESTPQETKLGKVSILGKLYQFTKKIKEKIIPSKRKNEDSSKPFMGQKHVWYDENDEDIAEPTPEILQEYDNKGLHYIEIREISSESELIEHHLGKEISIEQYAKMLPSGVNLGKNDPKTAQHNEQQVKQLNILSNQLTGDAGDMDIFRPLLKRLKEMNPLKEANMRKMAKEFEKTAQFMYMINRDILKGKNVEELNRIKFEFEANLRDALVHEQRGTIDYVVFVELLETVCNTYRKAENDEVAQKVSEDMEKVLTFVKDEKEKRLTRLAIEKPVQQPKGIPADYITEMMTTYIGADPITMTKEEVFRMLEEKEELAKRDGTHLIIKETNHNTTQTPKKYTPFTFPYERAFEINGKLFVVDDGIMISEDGKEYVKTGDGRLVLKDDDQR